MRTVDKHVFLRQFVCADGFEGDVLIKGQGYAAVVVSDGIVLFLNGYLGEGGPEKRSRNAKRIKLFCMGCFFVSK